MDKIKALVVDDDAFIRAMLSEVLNGDRFAVTTAENGKVAFERFVEAGDFDLIVADMNMPVMDGLGLIKALRKEAQSEVPIIILTGNNEVSVAINSLKAGANDYLLKDENIQDTLFLSIDRVLDNKRMADQNRQLMADIQRINKELESVVGKMTEIGTALSAEKDFPKLLEMIVSHARSVANADAGTLYLVENNFLRFVIIQNDAMKVRMGGRAGDKIPYPPVEITESNVSGFVALKGEPVNIEDVYHSGLFDFTGPKNFDIRTGYRSKSMLVVPLKNHENDVVGVLQLLNAIDPATGETIAFLKDAESLAASIASQAAVAVTNALLIRDMERLFEAFVEVMATAIDEKSPVTGGHIRRMTELTLAMAGEVDAQKEGPFKDIKFDPDKMNLLKIAALMHDIGKVTTPVEIIEKGKKLQTIFDRVGLVRIRIKYAARLTAIDGYKMKLQLLENGAGAEEIRELENKVSQRIKELDEILEFVTRCNEPGEFLEDDKLERLKAIRNMAYTDVDGKEYNFLTDDELENLSIRKGSITEKERKKMQDHAVITLRMLGKIPFTKRLRDIPKFAGAHHEFINGKGYPLGLKGDDIPFEGRLMAVTDIAEALTAADRPYKKAMPLENVYRILRAMSKNGELDPDMVELFIENKVYERYKKRCEERASTE